MKEKQVLLFGGKGGVGKTTCSSAVAAYCASIGKKTIVITSDLTPSLSDIFEMNIGDRVVRLDKNLFGIEISQAAIVARWKERFSRDFYDVLSQLIDLEALDSDSRHQLLDYIGSAPSLREETMLDLIVDMVESGDYERVIWDTAPAGETLNLLDMPRFIRRHLTAGAKVFEGLDKIGKQLIGRRSIADTMDEWIQVSERIARFIRSRTAFVIVARPEGLVVKHVQRLAGTLKDYEMEIGGVIINCVRQDADPGRIDSMRCMQESYISELRASAADKPVAVVPVWQEEIRGIKALRELGALLCTQLGLL